MCSFVTRRRESVATNRVGEIEEREDETAESGSEDAISRREPWYLIRRVISCNFAKMDSCSPYRHLVNHHIGEFGFQFTKKVQLCCDIRVLQDT